MLDPQRRRSQRQAQDLPKGSQKPVAQQPSGFLKEFGFVNNAKKVTFLYKEDDGDCENELMKFEEDERRFAEVFTQLIVLIGE